MKRFVLSSASLLVGFAVITGSVLLATAATIQAPTQPARSNTAARPVHRDARPAQTPGAPAKPDTGATTSVARPLQVPEPPAVFQSAGCSGCHMLQGHGGKTGPD